jgi:hypothetical protein
MGSDVRTRDEKGVHSPRSGLKKCNSTPISSQRGRVSFSKIQIREYERSVGDNVPTDGVPMSLGWNYHQANEMDVSDHDQTRRYRSQDELKLPNHTRMKILSHFGYSVDEQMQALEEANSIRSSREASAAQTPQMDRAEYALEKAKKTMKKMRKRSPTRKAKEQFEQEVAKLIDQDRMRTGRRPMVRRYKSMD